jgi:processive 1,2-diacylglycerol beta-glucosyltransferase
LIVGAMRILIATVTAGAGHLQAALALEEAWKTMRPGDEIRRVDVLDYTPRLYRSIYVKGYLKLIKHAPELWAMLFKRTDNPGRMREITRFRRHSARLAATKFVRDMVAFEPDVLLATHFLPLEILSGVQRRVRRSKRIFPFTACMVTDFEAHALWMEPCANLFCVAAEETKARLVARGLPSDNVVVTGIPIAQKFSARVNAAAIRSELQLKEGLPTLLVLGGGFGIGPVADILSELNKIETPLQVIVVCGRNDVLKRKLSAMDHRHTTRVLGFATNMHELLAVSDLILTKPGGLTSSEALAMGKPLMILNPIPGQEAANSDFLLEKGAAVKVNCLEDLPFKIGQLLHSKRLAQMSRAARMLGKPDAARVVCETVLDRLEQNSAPEAAYSSTR